MNKNSRIEEINRGLKQARDRYNAEVKLIAANDDLSGHGKDSQAKAAKEKFNMQVATLRAELKEATNTERARLEANAFAAPRGHEQSYRDTLARLSAVTDRGQRAKLFELAVKTNDTVSLRALAAISHSDSEGRGWQTIASIAENDRDINALVDFEKTYGELRSKEETLFQNMESFAHARPSGFTPARNNKTITVEVE